MPEVSVVVPVYKVEPYLRRCVDSILNQTYTDFQLILVDDGSPDNCGKICDEYAEKDTRIHVIHRENGGLSAARNSGIDWVFEHSYTEWITFIDSDDWVNRYLLEYMLKACKQTNTKVVMCGYTNENIEQEAEYSKNLLQIIDSKSLYNGIDISLMFIPITAWAKLYYTQLFQTVRYPEGKKYEDGFTTHKLLLQNEKMTLLNLVLYHYFVREDSIMNEEWDIRNLDGIEATKERMKYFKAYEMEQAYKIEIYHYLNDIAINYRRCRESKKGKEYQSILRRNLKRSIKEYRTIICISYASLYATMYNIKNPFHRALYVCLRFYEVLKNHIRK